MGRHPYLVFYLGTAVGFIAGVIATITGLIRLVIGKRVGN